VQPFWGFGGQASQDVEAGMGALYPGIDAVDNQLRWGFVRKVRLGGVRAWVRAAKLGMASWSLPAGSLRRTVGACRQPPGVGQWVNLAFVDWVLLDAACGQAAAASSGALPQPAECTLRLAPHLHTAPSFPLRITLQVYGIISVQLVLTTIVAAAVVLNANVQHFLLQNVGIQIALLLVSILALIPLYIWRHSHPHNLVLLGVWTCLFSGREPPANHELTHACKDASWCCPVPPRIKPSVVPVVGHHSCRAVTVGMACSFYQPVIVLEALFLTAAVVLGLTAYTFHATRRGTDLTFMGEQAVAAPAAACLVSCCRPRAGAELVL
jgi:FtsH-binding integral membrane protein